jgi:hypothetical protein
MKDITGALVASLFVVFVLISLLSVDRTQNSGLVTSHGKLDSESSLTAPILLQLHQHVTD